MQKYARKYAKYDKYVEVGKTRQICTPDLADGIRQVENVGLRRIGIFIAGVVYLLEFAMIRPGRDFVFFIVSE
jgi:hypothetical protein